MMKETKDERWKALTVAFVLVFAAVAALISVPYTASATYGTPEITDNSDTMATTGEGFTFNASVTNSSDGNVWANYSIDGGSWQTLELPHTGWNMAYANSTTIPSDAQQMTYYLAAYNTTMGNWTETGDKTIEVTDNDAPSVADNTMDTPMTGDDFVVNATASDNVGIDHVNVTYSFDGGTPTTEMMTHTTADYYENTLSVPMDATQVTYSFTAYDTADPTNTDSTGDITEPVVDNDAPYITDMTNTGARTNDTFMFKAAVEDNIDAGSDISVHAAWWTDMNSTEMMASMSNTEGMNYSAEITIPNDASTLYYYINATDSTGNTELTSTKTVQCYVDVQITVLDNDTHDPIEGADINLEIPSGTYGPVTTDQDGEAFFYDRQISALNTKFVLTIEKYQYKTTITEYDSAEVTGAGLVMKDAMIEPKDSFNMFFGPIQNKTGSNPTDAEVTLTNETGHEIGTKNPTVDGMVTFKVPEDPRDKLWKLEITHPIYQTVQISFVGSELDQDQITLIKKINTVNVGPIKNSDTGENVSDIDVTLFEGSTEIGTKYLASDDGMVTFDLDSYDDVTDTTFKGRIVADDFEIKEFTFTGTESSEIMLTPRSEWPVEVGPVMDMTSGDTLSGQSVTLEARGNSWTDTTDSDGMVNFMVDFRVEDDSNFDVTVEENTMYMSETISFTGNESQEIHLERKTYSVTAGGYKDVNGKFIPDAIVTLRADGNDTNNIVATNDFGEATFEGLTFVEYPDDTNFGVKIEHHNMTGSINFEDTDSHQIDDINTTTRIINRTVKETGEDGTDGGEDTTDSGDEATLDPMMVAGAGVLILIIIIIAIAMIMKGGKEETAGYEYEEEEGGFGEEETGEEELFEEEEEFGEEEAGEEEELFEEEEEFGEEESGEEEELFEEEEEFGEEEAGEEEELFEEEEEE